MARAIDIYRPGTPDPLFIETIKPNDNSVQEKVIMGVNELRISFKLAKYIDFHINDYTDLFGERYKLNVLSEPQKSASNFFEYNLTMQSYQEDLRKVQFMFLGDDNSLKETEFALMGTQIDFVNLVVANMNRVSSGWTVGEVDAQDPPNYKNMTFSQSDCYTALQDIAANYETEFWVIGQQISLAKKRYDTGLVFRNGLNKGLYKIIRNNINTVNLATRLIVFGSEKNIPSNYRGYQNRLLMSAGIRYVEQNVDLYGVIEAVKIFDDIMPEREGTVTGVDGADEHKFTDSTIDFDINAQLAPGLTAKLTFNTGQLSGYTFEISAFNNSTKEFTILQNKDETTLVLPSPLLKPGIGDKYVLIDILMPDSYVLDAEDRLQVAARAHLATISMPQVAYQVEIDPAYVKLRDIHPDIGNKVWINDPDFGISKNIPVTNMTRNIVREWEYNLTLAEQLTQGPITILQANERGYRRRIRELQALIAGRALFNNNIIGDINIVPGQGLTGTSDAAGLYGLYIDPLTHKIVFVHP